MRWCRRAFAVAGALVAISAVVGCASGGDEGGQGVSTPSTVADEVPDRQLEQVVAALWRDRHDAIVAESASALAEIEVDPALESDRAYFIEYCPGYCPPLLATSGTAPTVRLLGSNAAQRSAVAVVDYTSSWDTGEDYPAAALVRIEATDSEIGRASCRERVCQYV